MDYSKVYDMIYIQDKVQFSKGYKVFEEVYEELKEKLNLKREEKSQGLWTLVIITKGE